jgi:hypothetical protein
VLVRFGKGFIETYSPKGEKGAMTLLHIEVRRMQYAHVEIEVPDEATGDEIEAKAIQSATEWKPLGNPYIEHFEDITDYENVIPS